LLEISFGPADLSERDLRYESVKEAMRNLLCVADASSYLDELAAEGEALGKGVRREDGGGAAVQRIGKSIGVAGSASKLDRLSTDRVAACSRVLISQRSPQAGEKSRPELDVVLGEDG
jgi:hypothetical protein